MAEWENGGGDTIWLLKNGLSVEHARQFFSASPFQFSAVYHFGFNVCHQNTNAQNLTKAFCEL